MHPLHHTHSVGADIARRKVRSTVMNADIAALNQLLAGTIALRDLYKTHRLQVAGDTFSRLHPLFEKHASEQSILVDTIAERSIVLGGNPIAVAQYVGKTTRIACSPKGGEAASAEVARLLDAHEAVLKYAYDAADLVDEQGASATDHAIIDDVMYRNELQVWFLLEHLTDILPARRRI